MFLSAMSGAEGRAPARRWRLGDPVRFSLPIEEKALAEVLLDRATTVEPLSTADNPPTTGRPAFSRQACCAIRSCWTMAALIGV